MPVLFIGSGIPKRYLHHYPDWERLWKISYKKISDDPYQYQGHIDALTRKYDNQFDININFASIIEDQFNSAFYARQLKLKIGGKDPHWVKQGISPYKMYLAHFFKKMSLHRNPSLDNELEAFRLLKNKISAIITTNYDLFLENEIFPNDYQVFCHQNELFSSDSYNIAEIYKIHGSALDADSILITRKDYNDFNSSRKLFIAKMLTLFAESPIIFLGYSFTDKNIQDIISDFLSCLTHKELENIENHFVFISYKKGELHLKEVKRIITTANGSQIPITEIETDNYLLVYETLNKITPGISPSRIRETKMLVKTIVEQNTANEEINSVIIDIDDLNDIDLKNKPLAIAIGKKETLFGKLGYGMLDTNYILEDILFDNKHLDSVPEFYKKAAILLKNIRNFDISDVKEECKKLFRIYDNYSTHFLRCVMYVDLVENKKEN